MSRRRPRHCPPGFLFKSGTSEDQQAFARMATMARGSISSCAGLKDPVRRDAEPVPRAPGIANRSANLVSLSGVQARGRAPSARPPAAPRSGSGGRGWCRRCPRAARPSRAPARRRRRARKRPAPTAWMPSTRLLSARATTRTKPSSAASVIARPLAVKGNWPMRISRPLPLRLLGGEAGGDDLGVGEADRRDAALVPGAAVAGDDLGDHLALRHGAVREHRLAGHVADRVDAAHRGAALVVDADERAVAVEVDLLEPPAVGRRAGGRR